MNLANFACRLQVLSEAIVEFMIKIDVKEIHGFDSKLGLRCFKESLLRDMMQARGIPVPECMLDSAHENSETGNDGTAVTSPSSTEVPPVSITSAD